MQLYLWLDYLIILSWNIKDEIINPINITNNYSVPVKDIALKTSKILNFKGKILNDKNYIDGDMIKKMDKQSKRYKKYFRKLKYTNIDLSIMKTINYYLENIKNWLVLLYQQLIVQIL